MSDEPLLPVERLLFRGVLAKIGRFDCAACHPCFPRTAPLHNDLFVLPRRRLWWRRGYGEYRFLEPGAAILHRAGREVERRAASPGGDLADWFALRPDVFEEILRSHGLDPSRVTDRGVSCITTPRFRLRTARLLAAVEASRAENPGPALDSRAVEEGVLALFSMVAEELAGPGGTADRGSPGAAARRRMLADRTRARISESPESGEGLDEIARAVGSSAPHLCRVFRAECGITLHEYRQRQRLGHALDRMRRRKRDLTELALELGYSSHSHFSRVFRQYLGVPPSAVNGP